MAGGGLKTRYKVAGIAILVVGGIFVLRPLIPNVAHMAARVPDKVDISAITVSDTPSQTYQLPASPSSDTLGGSCARVLEIPWNAIGALNLANGDARTSGDSLMKQYAGPGCLSLERQDDYGAMQTAMLKFAEARANGQANPNDPTAAAFSVIMGDGYPQFAATLEPKFEKLHQHLAAIPISGFSNGEDKCLAPPTNGNPQNAKGDLIAAVARDGDQDICVKWASDNGIPINTDNTVYDPDALNFVDTDSFQTADDKFISGACEDRTVAHKGIKTNQTKHVCVNGVATWTPGDVTVVEKKGGVVPLASTREYNQQMPALLVGDREWIKEHHDYIIGMLRAMDRAAFKIRTDKQGLNQMAIVNAAVWGVKGGDEAKPEYWAKYFVGSDETDSQGNKVHLGGSRVVTLAELSNYVGLTNGAYNVYKADYKTFGDFDHKFYPTVMPNYPAYDTVVDTSYIQDALNGVNVGAPTTTQFATAAPIATVVSQKAYTVEFDTGKATIRPSSTDQLFAIADQAATTNLRVRIDGHTDNTGDPTKNMELSRERAQSVADWLTKQAPNTFPANRLSVRGYGDSKPVGDNSTDAGRQQNRRVEVVLGTAAQ